MSLGMAVSSPKPPGWTKGEAPGKGKGEMKG